MRGFMKSLRAEVRDVKALDVGHLLLQVQDGVAVINRPDGIGNSKISVTTPSSPKTANNRLCATLLAVIGAHGHVVDGRASETSRQGIHQWPHCFCTNIASEVKSCQKGATWGSTLL